jgi:hypothetical protein
MFINWLRTKINPPSRHWRTLEHHQTPKALASPLPLIPYKPYSEKPALPEPPYKRYAEKPVDESPYEPYKGI